MLEFEVSDFSVAPGTQRIQFSDIDAAVEFAESIDACQCIVYVAHIVDRVDNGNFYIWRNNDVALVRLDEHREHHATDPSRSETANEEIGFFDESGNTFRVQSSAVVSWELAAEALKIWLSTGQKSASLSWS